MSGGDLEKLAHYLEVAEKDYRDVLYFAEYDRDDKLIPEPYKDILK